jgi:hypothetical protein
LSAEQREAILREVRSDVRDLLTGDDLLVSSMYPVEMEHHFLEVFARVSGDLAMARIRAMGAEVAETDLRGVYRIFIWAASVPQTLAVLTKVWNSYFSTGVARWSAEGRGRGVIRITDRHQHPLNYGIVAGYLEVAIRLAGGTSPHAEIGALVGHTVPFLCTWRD